MKRQRGRGRKSGNSANRSYESNGPEVKIRGNASQIYDKYLQLARDASSAGDRVRAENLYQHAEHYYRIVQANMPKRDPNQDDGEHADANGDDEDMDATSEDTGHAGQSSNNRRGRDRGERNERGRGRGRQPRNNDAEKEDPLGVVTPEGDASDNAKSQGEDASEDEAPRRRTRRPRRTKAEIEADKAAAAAALENAGASDGDNKDDSDSEAA